MLPLIATQVTVPIPSQEPTSEGSVEGRPALSAEALANLRAAVVLRLLEAMMRQVGRSGDKGNAPLQLLDVLFAAMKALPPRGSKDSEPSRLANLLARLPAEMRPSIERLLTTALSVASTSVLLEIIRNPGGADARRLAQTLLAAAARETPGVKQPPAPQGGQRFASLEAQLAASRSVRQNPQAGASKANTGDVAILQVTLRRLFEGGTDPRPGHSGPRSEPRIVTDAVSSKAVASAGANAQGAASAPRDGTPRSAEGTRLNSPSFPPPAVGEPTKGMDDDHPQPDIEAENDDRPTGKPRPTGGGGSEARNSASVKAPEARTQESMQRLIAGIIANLTEDDVLILRLLLEAPLPELPPAAADLSLLPDADAEPTEDQPAPGRQANTSGETGGSKSAGPDTLRSETAGGDTDVPAASVVPRKDENTEAQQNRPDNGDRAARVAGSTVPLPDRAAERPPIPLALRDGVGVPVVPYLPAQEDVEGPEGRHREEADEEASDMADGNPPNEGDAEAGEQEQQPEHEAEPDSDLARRRGRVEEFVGPPDPGVVFYQKLGDYWT